MSALGQTLSDTRTITWRNVTRLRRQPDSIVFGIIQSIMFVLLFAYVFGGAIEVPGGGDYTDYLMGGIFVQTVAFTCATTCIAMADDLSRGLFDRFRSLPMSRSAVLAGRTFADLAFADGPDELHQRAGAAAAAGVNGAGDGHGGDGHVGHALSRIVIR